MIASENLDEKRPGATPTANMDSDQADAQVPDMNLLEQKLVHALTLHQSGQLDDAARLYRDVLLELPMQPNANHNLGVILLETKDFDTSLELFKTALEAAPEDPQYWISYVEALIQAGQYDYAGEVLNHGIEGGLQGEEVDALKRKLDETKTTPADVPVFASEQTPHKSTVKAKKNGKPSFDEMNRLVTTFNSGRVTESEQLASHMTQRYPRHGIGWKVLGAIRQQQGMMDEAFKAFKLAAEYLPNDSEAHYNLGNYYYDQGQLSAAAMCYQKAVRIEPGFAKAHYNLGSVQKDQKHFAAAEASYKKALKLSPANAQMHFNMGVVLNEQGQFAEAEAYLRNAIDLTPNNAELHYSLGGNLNSQGRLEDAKTCYLKTLEYDAGFIEAYCCLSIIYQYFQQSELAEESLRKAIAIKPDFALAHFNLGNRLRDQYRLEEAVTSYQNALQLTPGNVEIYNNLGLTLKELDRLEEAETCYRKAIELAPDYSGAYNNLGVCLKELVRIPEAITCCRRAIELSPDSLNALNNLGVMLYEEGSLTEAEAILKQALVVDPTFAKAYSNLGAVYDAQLKIDDAVKFMMRALAEDPNLVEGYNNLGRFHLHRENFAEAEVNLLRAIELKPDYYEAYSNLGSAHMMQGRLDLAVDWFRKALAIKPGYHQALSNLLFCITHNPVLDKYAIFAEHKTFGERFETPFKSRWPQLTNSKDKTRCLKIGFVSGDFRNHPVAFFIEPVLEQLAKTPGLSLYAYSNSKSYDKVSERIEKHFSEWASIIHLSDEAFAEKVREDGIDILMDLSGHTAGHRLLSFARKPAPVQASWIGCPSTTGLTAMDYYLADSYLLPPGQLDDQFTEKLVQLPASAPFMPAEYSPSINALPASTNKYFTFASFNRPSKLSQTVIALWARVLRAVPDSKMLLGAMQQDEGRAKILSWFEQEGVSADRLILRTRSDMHDYLKMHHEVDLCLDTFPYNGGTTTWHAIWMGVPTLTLAGDMLPSRIGAGILGHVGLDDFVVTSQDEFVEKGIYWTQHLDHLAQHRGHMRERFSRSAPGQPAVIANGLAAAFRTMWQRWCDDAPAASFEVRLPEDGVGEAVSAIQYAPEQDTARPAAELAVAQFEIVSATRLPEQQFWAESALGQSLKRLMHDSQALGSKITTRIAFENTRGLPDVFNECIQQASDDAILIFMHDDVWIDEPDFMGAVLAGLEHFDVVGVAGNRHRLPNQPSWNFIDTQFTWDSGAYLTGHVGHGPSAGGRILKFGPIPNDCELLDGVFFATRAEALKQHAILFDPQFDFHFYDMDFCRSARQAGLKLGTWSIGLTHQSEGAFGSQSWRKKYASYLDKWDAATKHEVASFLEETTQKEQDLTQALGEVLQLALEHQQAGETELAQKLYLEILNIQPRHAEANHKLGLIEAKLQGAEIAVPKLEIAVAEMPQNEQYWVSYIDALVQSGALESAAGAIELGQQFGLSPDTAQVLTAEISQLQSSNVAAVNISIHVHQIYYSGETQQQNDPGFESLDNLANPRPDWREYWPMRQYLLNNALDDNAYYGFLSPKFREKTNLSAADVYAFVSAHTSEADVFLFSPYFDQGAFSLNMFEQGESQHTDIKAAFEGSVAKVAPQVDLATLVMDSSNIVFCNYIVAKPVFWRAWLAICEQLFAEAEENMTALAASLNAGTSHNNAEAPNKVFVIERMASLMLSTQPKNKPPVWRVKAYDSTLLPFSIAPISHYPRELRQLDELKIEGTPQSLARYANIRDSLQERIQRPFEQELQQAVKEVLEMAKAQQSQGDAEQAAKLYAEVTKIQPRHAEANYQLGVIEAHSKGVKQAIPRFELAVQAAPENEQYWVAYIDALVLAGSASSAISAIELGQQYGLKPETAEMLKTEFADDLEVGLKLEKEQAIALQQSVLEALQLELKPSNKRPENTIDLANAKPVIYVWAPDYSEFSSGVKCLHLLCDRLNQLGYEAYVTAENTNKRLNAPTLTDELKQQHKTAGRLQIAIYPEVEAGNPLGVSNVVRYLLNQPNKFFKTSWFGKFHADEQVLHYDDSYTLPWVESQGVRIQTVNRDLFTAPADDTAERSGFLIYSHRENPDLDCIPDWCHPYQVISMEKPRLPQQLAALYQQSLGMIMFERSAASVEAMLCGCPIIYSSSRGLDRSTVFYHGYDDFDVAWNFDPAGFRQAQASVASFAAIYDGNVAADTHDLQIAISNIIANFRKHAPDVLETTPAYALAAARQSAQQGDIRTAILAYRQLLIDHADCVEGYYRMAETLAKIGLAKPALRTLQQGEPYLAQLPKHACLNAVRDMYMQKLAEVKAAT